MAIEDILVVGFSQISVSLLGLLFEKLQSSLQALVLRAVLGALIGGSLGLLETRLDLLKLCLEDLVLV